MIKKINLRKVIYISAAIVFSLVLGACGMIYAPPKSSEELVGTFDEEAYTNDYLGFRMTFPEGYTLLSKEEIDDLMAQTAEYLESIFEDPEQAEKAIRESTPAAMGLKHALGYTGGYNSNFNLYINEASAFGTADIVGFADKSIEAAQKQTEEIKLGKAAAVKIGGKDAAVAEGTQEVESYDVLQKQYYIASKNYVVVITLSAASEKEMDELTEMMDSIEFDLDI